MENIYFLDSFARWRYLVPSLLPIPGKRKKTRDPRNELSNGVGSPGTGPYRLDCQLHPQGIKPDLSSERLRLHNEKTNQVAPFISTKSFPVPLQSSPAENKYSPCRRMQWLCHPCVPAS